MIEQVFWLVEGRILVFRLTGPLTLEGLRECDAITVRMIAAEGKPPFVNVVYDLAHGRRARDVAHEHERYAQER